jgi:hypothetical protein
MDSTTGETSILAAGDIPKWEIVQDSLKSVYKMDPKTKSQTQTPANSEADAILNKYGIKGKK